MGKVIGKCSYWEMTATIDTFNKLEQELSKHCEDFILEDVYKSDWYMDEEGFIVAVYIIVGVHNPYSRYTNELTYEEFLEKIATCKRLEF